MNRWPEADSPFAAGGHQPAAAGTNRPGPFDADAVAALRARLGLSQAAFAAELGVRQQTVSEWETGRYRPRGASARMLRLLAERPAPYDASPPPPEPVGANEEPA